MDGTLINSGTIIANTINYVRSQIGLDPLEQNMLLRNVNDPQVNSAQFFYGSEVFLDHHTKLFEEYYEANVYKEIFLYDGIEQLLENLKSDGFDISIATNASNKFARNAIEHLKIDNHFKYIIGFDDVSKSKPDPEMVIKTLQDLQYSNDNSLLVGDSHKDFLAATAANVKCELVNWGFSDHDDAHHDVKSLYKSIVS
jgi:phosphoglycolate phosphatase